MKIPDGGKPIQVGDSSFIYKGVYHPIVWVGKEPYRPRVEMLVIKDARYVFLRLKDGIEKTPPDKRTYKYTIPGGSLDADSSKLEQAIAETNEEALINVSLVYNTGVSYYSRYEPGFILKGGDMPLEYVGSMSDVFIGVYDGPYDKSKVEEKDLDDDIANNGKFYEITKVAKYLRTEHIEALLRSQFVALDVKNQIQITRMDAINESAEAPDSPIVIPGGKLYHGTTYEIDKFKPMSLDLGNAFQKPGWSTFCFSDYEYAKKFAASKAFTEMLRKAHTDDESEVDVSELQVKFVNGQLVISKDCLDFITDHDLIDKKQTFYVYKIDASNLKEIGIGNDPALKEYTFRDADVPFEQRDTFEISIKDIATLIDVTTDSINAVIPDENSDYRSLQVHNYQKEKEVRDKLELARANGELNPGDDIEEYMITHDLSFDSDDVHLPDLSVDIDQPVFENGKLSQDFINIVIETKFPIECYGLPDRKAYPMPDEKHVRSAIRFFNYASKEEEKELAKNINKFIKKYKIKDISVGEKNRFKKYYQPITEEFTPQIFAKCLEKCAAIVGDDNASPQERYKANEETVGLCRMFIAQSSDDAFLSHFKDTSSIEEMVDACYNAISTARLNQIEDLAQMESKEIRTLKLRSVMEANDDPETATDYTAMADEAGAEGGDADEATGGDSATDYNQMADDEGAEDDDTDDTSDESDEDTSEEDESDEGATDYTAMADEAGAENDASDDDTSTDDETSSEDTESGDDNEENDKRYNNKEIKNYFLLNSYLSMHQTVIDVLDTVNGVVLPTPDANGIMAQVVKNLQSVKSFIEKFIQFQFSDTDYAFNLYYYNILMNALRMNLKLLESAVSINNEDAKIKNKKEE